MGCRPISSRLITIHLRAVPLNITVVQLYAPTSEYDHNKIEEFHDQLQNVIDQTPKEDILLLQGDWNAKVGKDACYNWWGFQAWDTLQDSTDNSSIDKVKTILEW